MPKGIAAILLRGQDPVAPRGERWRTMSEIHILGLMATLLGIVTAVLNLVAFVREKDRGHLRAGLIVLALLGVIAGLAVFPHMAPAAAAGLARRLPPRVAAFMAPWLAPQEAPAPPSAPAAAVVKGSFTIDIRRNLLGGINDVTADFQFADLSGHGARILAWRMLVQTSPQAAPQTFEGILDAPAVVPAGGTTRVALKLPTAPREAWLARSKEKTRGRLQVRWQGLDADGRAIEVSAEE